MKQLLIILVIMAAFAGLAFAEIKPYAFSFGSTGEDYGKDIATDSAGNIYAVGYFNGSVDFDPGTGTNIKTAVGISDICCQIQ